MRKVPPEKLEVGRIVRGAYASTRKDGCYGAFRVLGPRSVELTIIASAAADDDEDAQGWEHVSVSLKNRAPNWAEMCFVKDLFWDEDEVVVQFHPAKAEHVNYHPHCLHLWRHKTIAFPTPPTNLVGPK